MLWYVDVCLSKAVLGVAFLHGEARVTICWTQGVTHLKKKAGLRMWSETDRVAVVIGDDFWTLSGKFIVSPPRCVHSKSCAQSFVLNRML